MSLLLLPSAVLANILERIGDAGEVTRAASSCKVLWAAASGPLNKVHMLLLRSSGTDVEAQQLAALQQRYPGIRQLCVAYGSWQWTGCRSLLPWAATLTVLEANNTSFPATALLPSRPPGHQLQSATAPLLSSAARLRPACVMPATDARQGAQLPQQQQRQGRQLGQQQDRTPSVVVVPPELQGLTRLQLQQVVTTPVKCRTHGSSDCRCWEQSVLATLLKQNPGLMVLDLAGNTHLPSRVLEAALAAASLGNLQTLNLADCELLQPSSCIPQTLTALERLDISNTAAADADLQHLAAGLPSLKMLGLRGCRRVSTAGVMALAAAPALLSGCLTHIDCGGLTRPSAAAMSTLTAAWALASVGQHHSSSSSGARAVGQAACGSRVLLHVGFGRMSGVTDAALRAFAQPSTPAASPAGVVGVAANSSTRPRVAAVQFVQEHVPALLQQLQGLALTEAAPEASGSVHRGQQKLLAVVQPALGLCGLHLAGCNTVSSCMLLQLGDLGALAALTSLDISDMETFRHSVHLPKQQHQGQEQQPQGCALTGSTVSSGNTDTSCSSSRSSSCIPQPDVCRTPLPELLQHTGQHLLVLCLDSCFVDDAAAAMIAAQQQLPQLQELSMVGCRGLGNTGLRALLSSLPQLRHLSIGGSASAWNEGSVLTGLPVLAALTQLKLVRRPALRDAELAPLLAAASSLHSLSLVGCYMLTDKLFELVIPSSNSAADGSLEGRAMGAADNASGSSVEPRAAKECEAGNCAADCIATVPLQQHLTQLCATACDGICGNSIARLKGLRHLRISFCASLSVAAMQQVAVSCSRLQLMELPASLSRPQPGSGSVQFGALGLGATGAGHMPHSNSRGGGAEGRGLHGVKSGRRASSGGHSLAGTGPAASRGVGQDAGLVLPQHGTGHARHLQCLRVNWI